MKSWNLLGNVHHNTMFTKGVSFHESLRFVLTQLDTHTHTHTQSVALLRKSEQLVAETTTYTTHNKHKRQKSMLSAGFFFCFTWHLFIVTGTLVTIPHARQTDTFRHWEYPKFFICSLATSRKAFVHVAHPCPAVTPQVYLPLRVSNPRSQKSSGCRAKP